MIPKPTNADAYVIIALTNVLRDLWREEFPHKDYEAHPKEFQSFCENALYGAIKGYTK